MIKRKPLPARIRALPLEERAFLALKAAVKKAIAESLRAGLPVYVWRDGKVVDLSAGKLKNGRRRRRRSRKPAR